MSQQKHSVLITVFKIQQFAWPSRFVKPMFFPYNWINMAKNACFFTRTLTYVRQPILQLQTATHFLLDIIFTEPIIRLRNLKKSSLLVLFIVTFSYAFKMETLAYRLVFMAYDLWLAVCTKVFPYRPRLISACCGMIFLQYINYSIQTAVCTHCLYLALLLCIHM